MFDVDKIIKTRKLIDPIPTPLPAEFPHDEEVPEGCIELNGLSDDWGYNVDIHPDIVYAKRDQRNLVMTILEPRMHDGGPIEDMFKIPSWPCVVYIQGSAFHEQEIYLQLIRHIRLAQKGFAVAIVQYRPSDMAPFPAQMQDAKTAIRFVRKHADEYHIDPERIAVAGDSSGGHTALMAGFTGDDEPDTPLYGGYSAKVKGIVDLYGPTVIRLMNYWPSAMDHIGPDSPEGYENGRKNVLEHPAEADASIPMNYLSEEKETPPTLIIHGSRDMLVPFNQSVQLYNCMKEMGKDVTFYKINNAGHGVLGFDNDTVLGIVTDFLKKHLGEPHFD